MMIKMMIMMIMMIKMMMMIPGSQDDGEPLVVGDVLYDGSNVPPGLQEGSIVGPMRVKIGELEGDSVVFPEPERVEGGEARLLVNSVVAGVEAVKVGSADPAHLLR